MEEEGHTGYRPGMKPDWTGGKIDKEECKYESYAFIFSSDLNDWIYHPKRLSKRKKQEKNRNDP